MRWDPRQYGGIETVASRWNLMKKNFQIRVPPDKVWLPDIVLFSNADGNYLVSFYSNVVVQYTGEVVD